MDTWLDYVYIFYAMNERILKHKMSDNKAYLKLVSLSFLFSSFSFSVSFLFPPYLLWLQWSCTCIQNDPCLSFFILYQYIFYFS